MKYTTIRVLQAKADAIYGLVSSKRAHSPGIRHFFFRKSCKCPTVGPGVHTKTPRLGFKIGCKCPTAEQHQNFIHDTRHLFTR